LSSLLRTTGLAKVALVLTASELLLKPVDHVLEGVVELVVEEEATRFDLDELFDDFFLGNVGDDDELRVLFKDSKAVRDLGVVFLLLVLNHLLEIFETLTISSKLGMLSDFSDKSVAWSDVSFLDLMKVFEDLVVYLKL